MKSRVRVLPEAEPDRHPRTAARRPRRPMPPSLGRIGIAFCLCLSPGLVLASPAILSNPTTSVEVNGGEANNGLVPFNGYFRYTDVATGEETTWSVDPLIVFPNGDTWVLSNGSAGGFGSPVNLGGGVVRSTSTLADLTAIADTELVGSNARTTFAFTTSGSLDGLVFVFYAENDLFSAADDAAAFTGSIASGDLGLFMFDSQVGGLTVRMTGNAIEGAVLTLFGAGLWTGFGTAIEAGDLSLLSSDGSNFQPLGDLGLALAFSLSGSSARVVINYDTQPTPPGEEPFEAVPANPQIPIPCTGSRCKVPITCNLPRDLGTPCTNRIDLFVRRSALRLSDDASVKAPRRIKFAFGVASVPPQQTANVTLRLTNRGRRIAKTGSRRLRGVAEIRNTSGTAIDGTPVSIRIRRR